MRSTTRNSSSKSDISWIVTNIGCAGLTGLILTSFWDGFANIDEALAFYGVYHRYGWNQLIHFVGVPGILWSTLLVLVHIPILPASSSFFFSTESKTQQATTAATGLNSIPSRLNYANFISVAYVLFYLTMDPFGAILYSPVLYGMYSSAYHIVQSDQQKYYTNDAAAAAIRRHQTSKQEPTTTMSSSSSCCCWYGTGQPLRIAVVTQIVCWYVQIHWGHSIIEGAKPALLESVGGAFSVGPLFAFYEGLWYLGIHTQLQHTTHVLIDHYTTELCAGDSALLKACRTP